jgi:hypothetical protein
MRLSAFLKPKQRWTERLVILLLGIGFLVSLSNGLFSSPLSLNTLYAASSSFEPIDIRQHEGGKHRGHSLAKHVGLSEARLRLRLERESIPAASSFPDIITANHAINAILLRNESRIKTWLADKENTNRLRVQGNVQQSRYGIKSPIGTKIIRGEAMLKPCYGLKVILVKNPSMPQGFAILTSYPQ